MLRKTARGSTVNRSTLVLCFRRKNCPTLLTFGWAGSRGYKKIRDERLQLFETPLRNTVLPGNFLRGRVRRGDHNRLAHAETFFQSNEFQGRMGCLLRIARRPATLATRHFSVKRVSQSHFPYCQSLFSLKICLTRRGNHRFFTGVLRELLALFVELDSDRCLIGPSICRSERISRR